MFMFMFLLILFCVFSSGGGGDVFAFRDCASISPLSSSLFDDSTSVSTSKLISKSTGSYCGCCFCCRFGIKSNWLTKVVVEDRLLGDGSDVIPGWDEIVVVCGTPSGEGNGNGTHGWQLIRFMLIISMDFGAIFLPPLLLLAATLVLLLLVLESSALVSP